MVPSPETTLVYVSTKPIHLPPVLGYIYDISIAPFVGSKGAGVFTMDYSEPISLVQATQIAMATFDHKWAVE